MAWGCNRACTAAERDQVHSTHTPLGNYTAWMRETIHFMPRGKHLLAAALALMLLCTAAQAQWTWRDKDGRVTASDRPPPRDVPEKDILSRPHQRPAAATRDTRGAQVPAAAKAASAASVVGLPRATPSDKELEARKKEADAEKTAKQKAEEAKQASQRADNCRRARAEITALDSGQRMSRLNDKGEREVLDDKGRAEEVRRARDVVTSDCN